MFFLLCVILFTSDRVISCFYKKYAVLTDPLLVCSWISLARKIKTLHACLYSTLFDFTKKYISGVLPVALNLISSWRDGDSFTGLGWQNTFAGRNFRETEKSWNFADLSFAILLFEENLGKKLSWFFVNVT